MADFSMTDLWLADQLMGRAAWRAIMEGAAGYDGHSWVLLPTPRHYRLSLPLMASDGAVAWWRHWLTQGVVEVTPAVRRYPDCIDRMHRTLRPVGHYAQYGSFGGVITALMNEPKGSY